MGSIVSGFLSADDAQHAADTQANMLTQASQWAYSQMDPTLVNQQALAADQSQAKNRLALQGQIDPALLQQRGTSESMLSNQLAGLGNSNSDAVAAQAAQEALAPQDKATAAKNQLIDSALDQIKAGATLPPDVQAQLMQSGLEQAGAVQGAATARGAGGSILQQVLGTAGIQLQQQRQQQAASLLTSASNLDAQRQQILQGLFPKLQQQQMSNIAGTSGILQQSNTMLPQAGLSGSDVANVWLARVGAQNKASSDIAGVVSKGQLASSQARDAAIGSAVNLAGSVAMGI